MMNKLFGFLALATIIAATGSANPSAQFKKAAIDNVLNKLQRYEQGIDLGDLTIQECANAFEEYKSWPANLKAAVLAENPIVQLLADFLMIPMERFPHQIGLTEKDVLAQRHFVQRLQWNYKRFKPLYFGKTTSKYHIKSPKTEAVVNAVFNIKGAAPLTGKLVQAAKNEYLALKARMEEISKYEDIYASLDEFERIKNYMNNSLVNILVNSILPNFKSVNSFTEETARVIREAGQQELKKFNVIVDDGVFKTVVYTKLPTIKA